MTKNCIKCGQPFSPSARQIQDHWWICVPCRRAFDRAYYLRRKSQGLRVSGTKTWDAEKRRAWHDYYYKQPYVRKAQAERARLAREQEREKYLARVAVRTAVRRGKIAKAPCENCGATRVQAHHVNYKQPLSIKWLCRLCHEEEHRCKARGEQ